jgi:hypothetical protein
MPSGLNLSKQFRKSIAFERPSTQQSESPGEGTGVGMHDSSGGGFPFVVGVDGVGRLEDGRRVAFALPGGSVQQHGGFAVRREALHPGAGGLDDALAAALINPGRSSCAALKERARLKGGETVLINGATGVAGRLAMQSDLGWMNRGGGARQLATCQLGEGAALRWSARGCVEPARQMKEGDAGRLDLSDGIFARSDCRWVCWEALSWRPGYPDDGRWFLDSRSFVWRMH